MLETYSVSFGVAVRPICVAPEKYVEDFPPGRILGRAAAMALVDHDQVEEAGRELAEQLLPLLRAGDRLIEAEIDLEGGVDPPLLVERERQVDRRAVLPLDGLGVGRQLRHRRAERAEVVHHRLVDQHVAVGEEQDALLAARLPQPPDDLERGVGLARAGRHDQQDAVAALGDGLDRGVDGVDLIIARGLAAAVVEIVLKHDLFGFGVKALPGAIARPQIGRRRKGVEAESSFRSEPSGWRTANPPPVARRQSVSEIHAGRPDTLSKARTWPLLAAMNRSRSSRGKARSGAVFGSSSARRIAVKVDLAEPCSPDSTITG